MINSPLGICDARFEFNKPENIDNKFISINFLFEFCEKNHKKTFLEMRN